MEKKNWIVAQFYFMMSITYLITIMNVQTFESEQKFNVSLQNHIEPQPWIIVTTSIAYKLYHLYSFIEYECTLGLMCLKIFIIMMTKIVLKCPKIGLKNPIA